MSWFMIYLWLAPVALGWAMWRSGQLVDPGLSRCAVAIGAQFVVTQLWFAALAGRPWAGQPWAFYMIAHAASTWVVLQRPASRGNAVMGGVTLFGATVSALHGARVLFYGYTPEADWSYWYLMFFTGWVALLVLVGWSHVDTGRRCGDWLRGRVGAVFRAADNRGLAR